MTSKVFEGDGEQMKKPALESIARQIAEEEGLSEIAKLYPAHGYVVWKWTVLCASVLHVVVNFVNNGGYLMGNNFIGYCEDCINFDKEVAFLKKKIEQLQKEIEQLYDRCLENEEAMYDAVINGNDNQLIELVEQGVNKI